MRTYEQKTGWLIDTRGFRLSKGYAGGGAGKNNPAMQGVKNVGPIPRGRYEIEEPIDTVTHGPCVLRLVPDATNEMHGRSGFLMHGDSVVNPGTASEGCIVQPRFAREKIWQSGDRALEVVSGESGIATAPAAPREKPGEGGSAWQTKGAQEKAPTRGFWAGLFARFRGS